MVGVVSKGVAAAHGDGNGAARGSDGVEEVMGVREVKPITTLQTGKKFGTLVGKASR